MANKPTSTSVPTLSITCSPHYLQWLHDAGLSLAITTYQTNRLFLIGLKTDDSLSAFERLLDGAMGLYATPERLYLATRYQLWQFDNSLSHSKKHDGYDKLYVPRVAHTTGNIDMHDVAVDKNDRILFINTLYSCLATTSERFSFTPLWKPEFISKLVPEDRCHLNGLAMAEGEPRYVTAISRSDVAAGWRGRRQDGGCVIDIQQNEIIAAGLSMPHSPRFHQGKLWLLNSGTGELGYIDTSTGRFEAIAFCPGYVRGLTFHDGYAVVALSKPRHNKIFNGLDLDKRLADKDAEPRCGVWIIDLKTGHTAHWLEFEGVVNELYDVQVLPGVRRPMALGFKSDEIHRLIGFEDQGALVLHDLATSIDPAAEKVSAQSKIGPAPAPEAPYVYQVDPNIPLSTVLEEMKPLTFPSLAKQADVGMVKGRLIAVSALHHGIPVGLVLAEHNSQENTAKLLSLFVTPDHRRQGIGSTLLTQIEQAVAHQGGSQLEVAFQSDWAHVPAIEHMLQKHGWSPPRAWMMLYKGTMQGIAEADWLDRCRLPDDFEIFPWAELTGDERKAILERQETEQWFPSLLTPFQEEDRIEYMNSVGLRYRNEVVGWMITHRIAADTIQYTSLFVRKDLQRLGRAIPLLAASIKRQMASDVPRGVCQVQVETKRMVDCIRRRILPYHTSLRELRCSRKELASLSQASQERLSA